MWISSRLRIIIMLTLTKGQLVVINERTTLFSSSLRPTSIFACSCKGRKISWSCEDHLRITFTLVHSKSHRIILHLIFVGNGF